MSEPTLRAPLLALLALLAACDSGPKGPGFLTGAVEGPASLGAVQLEVSGAGIVGFEGAGTTRVFSAPLGEDAHRVVLVGETAGDLRFRIEVTDRRSAPPSATVLSASDEADLPVSSLQPFRVRIAR